MNEDLVKTLKKFELSKYESKVYIALTSIIRGTAAEISKEANIPRSKSYEVLKNLERKNFIEIKDNKPIIYEVIPPKKVFKEHRKQLINDLDKTERKLEEIYEDKVSQVQAPIWLIPTEDKIIQKEIELIKSAKKTINIRIGFVTSNELENLIKALKNKKSSFKIKILTTNYCFVNGERIDMINLLKSEIKNIEVKKSNIPFVKLIIKDNEEMFHIYAKQDEETKEIIPNTMMGVWNRYDAVSKNYYERFEKQFKNEKD